MRCAYDLHFKKYSKNTKRANKYTWKIMPRQRTKATNQPSLFAGNGKDKQNTKASLSSLVKSARDIMRKDAGLNGDLDRLPQLSWVLCWKCYDDLELRREEDAKLERKAYKPVIPPPYRWRDWASDEDNWATGEDLIKFVNDGRLPA